MVAAWEIPKGIINAKPNICISMPWAANSTFPIHPIITAAALKLPTSASVVRPIGKPIFIIFRSALRSGLYILLNNSKFRIDFDKYI